MRANIKIDQEQVDRINLYKATHKMKSQSEVIKYLLDLVENNQLKLSELQPHLHK